MKLKIVIGAIALVIVLGVYMGVRSGVFSQGAKLLPAFSEPKLIEYASETAKVSFKYPDSYIIQERDLAINGDPFHLAILTRVGDVIPENGEGSTVITLSIFDLSKPQSLKEWLGTMTNIMPEPAGGYAYKEGTLGGEKSLRYTSTGLYESENVAVQIGNRVYVFSSTWLTREDQILKDFEALLSTVTFTK